MMIVMTTMMTIIIIIIIIIIILIIIILSHASRPLMYILFENFKLCFNSAISLILFSADLTKSSIRPGDNSLGLSCQSPTQVPTADQIHFAEERIYDAPLNQLIAGDLLCCKQKLFHFCFSELGISLQ